MVGTKEIRTKIKSVQNTQKITKAMEMVASSKMRHALERMHTARPYSEKIKELAVNASKASSDYRHPFMLKINSARKNHIGVILITTDKALCGSINTNLLRMYLDKHREYVKMKGLIDVTAIGGKGAVFLARLGANIVSQQTQIGEKPHVEDLIGVIKPQLDAFAFGHLDSVYLMYTKFVSTMKQQPVFEKLLPLSDVAFEYRNETDVRGKNYSWDYIYEPDPKTVIDDLFVRYIEARVYQAVAENIASEQSSRMIAMRAASDNAKIVIDEMQMIYNNSRQAAITKEISEIVGGAAAV